MNTNSGSTLHGDIFGGITAGIVALPLALAFGVQSGMGAIAGLYGAIALGIVAAWFGGTPTQISGPTGPMTVVSSVVIAGAISRAGSLDDAIGSIVLIFLLGGAFQIIMGLFKIGTYVRYIPYPVVSGFMSGIGVIIITLELLPALGHVSPKHIPEILSKLPDVVPDTNIASLLLALSTIAIIYIFPKISKAVPSPLVALIVMTILSTLLGLDVHIIGNIPTGIPDFQLDELGSIDLLDASVILAPALTLATLGAIDSLLTSVVADNMTKTQHQSNKELIGQGMGNMAAAVIGGIPGAGATMRTVVNIKSGGKTRLSGVIHGFLLLLILFGLGRYASLIPHAVLAGILITVGIGIIDYKGIKHLHQVPLPDAAVMLIVLGVTVFVDLLQAVASGLILACLLFMKKMGDIVENTSELISIRAFGDSWAAESIIPDDLAGKIYIKRFEGPLFFGFSNTFQAMLRELPEAKLVILRMAKVPYIDQTGLYAIEDALLGMQEKNVVVLVTGLQEQPLSMLKRIDVVPDLLPDKYIFRDFGACIEHLEANLLDARDKGIPADEIDFENVFSEHRTKT